MHHKEDLTNGIRSELLIETSYSLGKIFYFFTGPRYKFQFPGQNLKHEKKKALPKNVACKTTPH